MSERTDVCIIGTGFGGAIAAYYLARAGRKVVLLERGRRYRDDELQLDLDPKKLLPLVHQFTGNGLTVIAGSGVGGGSLVYSGASLRAPSFVFERKNARGRIWPRELSRRSLDPWYQRAEIALGTHQLSFREVGKRGGVWARRMNALGYRVDPIRQATTACLHCGFCNTGCRFRRKNHLPMNYLLGAERAGAEIRPESEAVRIEPADGGYRVTYGAPDHTNLLAPKGPPETTELQAEQVILAGGTMGTAGLLLRSRQFLPGLSDQVGKNLSGNGDFALAALLPEDPALPGRGLVRHHQGVAMDTVCYEFLESHGFIIITQHQLATATLLNGDAQHRWWGRGKKDVMRDYGERMLGLAIIGVDGSPGQVRSAGFSSDQYGLSPAFGVSDIDFPVDRTTQKLYADARRIVGGLLQRMGGQLLDIDFNISPAYGEMAYSAHPIGTARMGDTPQTGVVDVHGEVFGHPGLFVVDGAAVPTALGVNPSLTIAANAERLAAGLVGRLGKRQAPPPVANPYHRPRLGEGLPRGAKPRRPAKRKAHR